MTHRSEPRIAPRPFLKWVGGKGQLLPELWPAVLAGRHSGRYHEPFVGGGALFFDLFRRGALGRAQAFLSDNNPNLIAAYLGVRNHVEDVIRLLEIHKERHSHDYFYAMRATVPDTLPEQAARIIYLNKTCFNGLYRENSRGQFNVPIGRYANPLICDAANLRAVAHALGKAKVDQRPFESVLTAAKAGDLVYFDPPYDPVSKTASFTSYEKSGFGEKEQRRLAEVAVQLSRRKINVILSNSWTPLIQSLYSAPPFRLKRVEAARQVNSRADRRGKIFEALVTNFDR